MKQPEKQPVSRHAPLRLWLRHVAQAITPAQLVLLTFLFVAVLGAVLLSLPLARQPLAKVTFIDALFTSVSAVCVTGLVTVNTAETWSVAGKAILLMLIQIGGIGLVSVFFYFMVQMGRKITLRNRLAIQTAFNASHLKGMVRLITTVIRGTLLFEGAGALLLFFIFLKDGLPPLRALGYGVFHAVSAFCNAGFDLIGAQNLAPYVGNLPLNLIVMALIILGGIGFSVWNNVILWLQSRLSRKQGRKERLTLHSRLALVSTCVLVVGGALLFLLCEYNNPSTLAPLSWGKKFLASFFQSVTLRTAGFSTVDQQGLSSPSVLLSSIWMLIGGSPGGTAGGIKTVTVAILACSVWSTLKGRADTRLAGRTIPPLAIRKALTVISLMILLLFSLTALLAFTERESSPAYSRLIFEVASALGTVGLSQNLTPTLTVPGQIVIMAGMMIGRLGPISLVLALFSRHKRDPALIRFPEEDLMIG